jgi:hypothetical protein
MNFKINDLPLKDFEALGLTKKDVVNFPPRTLNALLSGGRTSLMRFNHARLAGTQETIPLDAKISLRQLPGGKTRLMIHPVRQQAINHFNLSEKEIKQLNDGTPFVEKDFDLGDGNSFRALVTKDQSTNEFIAVKKDSIFAPDIINGHRLTDQQKEAFENGKNIRVGEGSFRVDPTSEIGITPVGQKSAIESLKFKHHSYTQNELNVDILLMGSGSGNTVMLEHLADMALHNGATPLIDHSNISKYSDAISEAARDIIERLQDHELSRSQVGALVSEHLAEYGLKPGLEVEALPAIQEIQETKRERKNTIKVK